ncbi:hypothetical protein E2C01_022944 [Portunus trituberculatus]|uniref:Uncharacterized protein n=1 Tax=Portunus trituberculatus TaxID=210409 RepID=A0A5B7E7H8_PORTR|nr:hypothetical protein [Portunus trituberculatus]
MGLSTLPASSPSLSQITRGSSPSCVETLWHLFRKRGFLQKAARFMALPVRQQSGHLLWLVRVEGLSSSFDLCDGLSKLFYFLWDTKHLSLPSIRGYRSALGPVFQQASLDISRDRDLSALFQGFAKLAPPCSPRISACDLSLVYTL